MKILYEGENYHLLDIRVLVARHNIIIGKYGHKIERDIYLNTSTIRTKLGEYTMLHDGTWRNEIEVEQKLLEWANNE